MLEEDGAVGGGHEVGSGTYKRKKQEYVARRVIVKLGPVDEGDSIMDSTADVMSAVEGAQVLRQVGATGRMLVIIPEGEKVNDYVKKFAGNARVEYAEPDFLDRAQIVPNDPSYFKQWGPPLVNAEAAWDLETGQNNVVIGIVDSGISMTGGVLDHDDLSDASRITLGTDFVDGGTPRDLHAHGTHVAGIAGASSNNAAGVAGMNWASPMYITRVFDANRNGSVADFADAVEETTDWAVARGLKAVINYSGGGGDSLTKRNACQYASDNGMLLVAATGNDNGGPVIWPAAYSTTITGVVAVGSTDSDDTVSSFSNVGPEVTVVAPGRTIESTLPTYTVPGTAFLNYGPMTGTSMATPLVTGLASLMWSRHPGHTNAKIKQCLTDTAVKLGSGNFNNNWGFGRVDALAALKCGDPIVPTSRLTGCLQVSRIFSDCNVFATAVGCRTRVFSECIPDTWICPRTRVGCPSRLPVLCPVQSTIVVCELASAVRITCGGPIRSLVDDCPSTPGGCRVEPIINPTVVVRPIEGLFGLDSESWYRDKGDTSSSAGDGWFYVDDDGNFHEI